MSSVSVVYAGFWRRLVAFLLDFVFIFPLAITVMWLSSTVKLFPVYWVVPGTLFGMFYEVYLVRRYGGTPGKLVAGIRIVKTDETNLGYREAFLRSAPQLILGLAGSIGLCC